MEKVTSIEEKLAVLEHLAMIKDSLQPIAPPPQIHPAMIGPV